MLRWAEKPGGGVLGVATSDGAWVMYVRHAANF